uniref:2OGFeDO JBP1/TET oxygenase domain-containing protein n=1 Tax=viral metagenome TaxID=1070528 RepID=A0A6C0F8B0_9ZZZZ|tara:strand:+ start:16173 stop:17339 length:1167 start_codon:yes stop_codon:yes gene_type:complete
MGRPKKLVVKKLCTDEEIKQREGTWITEQDIRYPVIDSNTDVYWVDEQGDEHLLLKFRKQKIHDKLIKIGWDSYKDLAKASRGRGASAGPIDAESDYWKKRNLVKTSKWSTGYLNPKGNQLKELYDPMDLQEILVLCDEHKIVYDKKEKPDEYSKEALIQLLISKQGGVSKMKVNNQVASNPIGFYEAGKNFADLPCRLTHFTRTNYERYNQGLPFLKRIDSLFKELVPESYQKQLERADLKPHLKIPDTCFSTVTINRNFRTALHRDAGDFKGGFGNLTVIEQGRYHGGYTVFPQFGVGINLRNNDFVAMDVHQWHANTEIYETDEDKQYNSTIVSDFSDNPEVGTAGLYKKYTRISFVCYLREKIATCPDTIDPRYLSKSGHGRIK